MTRAHEQTGLREPTHRAAEMCAINGKNLKLLSFDTPHPTCRVCRLAVRWRHIRISERGETRLSFRALADGTKGYPREIAVRASSRNRGQEESNNRNGERRCDQTVE